MYKLCKFGPEDDKVLIHAYNIQENLALELQKQPGQSKKKTGRSIQIQNKYKIIELFERAGNFEKMLTETETYLLLLIESGDQKGMEETYLWLF